MKMTERVSIVIELTQAEAIKLAQSEGYISQMLIETRHGDLVNEASDKGNMRAQFLMKLERILDRDD